MIEMKELDTVVLKKDVPAHGLVVGDVGTIVMVHGEGDGFEVEFIALDGETIVVETLDASDVRPTVRREIAHVRQIDIAQTS
jgi:hypothetical protein